MIEENTPFEQASEAPDLTKHRRRKSEPQIAVSSRLPPHNPEAEQACLGCIIIERSCIDECVTQLGPNGAEAFYDLRNQSIYTAMLEMSLLGKDIDTITLMGFLKGKQLLDRVGGLIYISSLPDAVPSAANLPAYLTILEDNWRLRRLIHTCTNLVGKAYDSQNDVAELLDQAERDVMSVRAIAAKPVAIQLKEPIQRAIQTIEDYHQRSGLLVGIPTGFHDLDVVTGGLTESTMIVIAARPSIGKTSLVMNIAENVALESKLPVGVFSLEMTIDSLVLRMLCSRSRVNLRNVKDGFLAERDFPKLTGSAGKLASAPMYIDDSTGMSIMDLRARARRMVNNFGIKLFVIDYLQLLQAFINGKRIEKSERELTEVSAGIKALAKELKVPIIAVSQLNRSMDKEKRKPALADLRGTGQLEQDADLVAMLYRPRNSDGDEQDNADAIPVNLLIAKQRNGAAGVDVNLTFLKSYTRFESAAHVSGDDYPDQRDFGMTAP